MRGGSIGGIIILAIGGIALADLVIHPKGTKVLANSAVRTETVGADALLGKTS